MNLETTRHVLLWCAVINYGLLLYWFGLYALAHDWYYRRLSRWFRMSVETFDLFNAAGMTVYKIGILLFYLVPYVVLRLVG